MNSELLGISYLKIALSQTDYLIANINDNDRTPSWDGDIEVYKKAGNTHPKNDLLCKIPIQVKCHRTSVLDNDIIKYSVKISDLKNYLIAGGTIFFVIYVSKNKNSHKIYYAKLLPFDLKKILNNYGNQKTKTIELKALPENNKDISNIFLNIAYDTIRQRPAINCAPVSYADLTKHNKANNFSLECINIENDTIYDYLFDNESYLYTKLDFGLELPILQIPKINLVLDTVPFPVSVGEKVFYDNHHILYKKDYLEIHIGESIKLIYEKNKEDLQFEFNLRGTLSKRIKDLEFFLAIIEAKQFQLGDIVFPTPNIMQTVEKSSFNLQFYKNDLEYYKQIKTTLDKLCVQEDLDCDKLNNNEIKRLNGLISIIRDSKPIQFENEAPLIGYISISNLNILLVALRNEKEKNKYEYNIYGLNNAYPMLGAYCAEQECIVLTSHYVMLKQKDMTICSNIDYKTLVKQIMSIPLSSVYFQQILNLINEMLKAFDENSKFKEQIINAVFELIEWLKSNEQYSEINILTLNYYQATKRKRKLFNEERQHLYSMIEDCPCDEGIYVSVYLLLEEYSAARRHFDLMEKDKQDKFSTFAISHFFEETNDK